MTSSILSKRMFDLQPVDSLNNGNFAAWKALIKGCVRIRDIGVI